MIKQAAISLLSVPIVLVSTSALASGPARVGAVGDSISTAMDANDDCDTLISCANRIGEDRAWSWTTGSSLTDSMRKKYYMSSTVEKQRNGARWDDANGQAQQVLSAGGASIVTVQMGANDICRKLNDTLPTKAEIKNHIHNTLTTLVNAPSSQRPATIIIGEVPDVNRLRTTMRNQDNFVFESCQDLWDLNTNKIEVNTCDWGFFDFLCDIADFIVETVADFVSPLTSALLSAFDVEFPCGYVLDSASNATKRSLAQALNNDINAAIAEEVAHHQGANGVQIKLAANVQEYQFTSGDVSQLDCFHPNRQGQKNLARTVWSGAGLGGTTGTAQDNGAPYMASSPASQAWWVGSGTYRDIYSSFHTNENAKLELYTYNCNTGAWYYEGTTNETPTAHEFHMEGFHYGYYWQSHVRPTDTSGNVGGWYNTGCI